MAEVMSLLSEPLEKAASKVCSYFRAQLVPVNGISPPLPEGGMHHFPPHPSTTPQEIIAQVKVKHGRWRQAERRLYC